MAITRLNWGEVDTGSQFTKKSERVNGEDRKRGDSVREEARRGQAYKRHL